MSYKLTSQQTEQSIAQQNTEIIRELSEKFIAMEAEIRKLTTLLRQVAPELVPEDTLYTNDTAAGELSQTTTSTCSSALFFKLV